MLMGKDIVPLQNHIVINGGVLCVKTYPLRGVGRCVIICMSLMGHTNLWHNVRMFKARNSFLSSFGCLLRGVCPAFFLILLEKNNFCPKISVK